MKARGDTLVLAGVLATGAGLVLWRRLAGELPPGVQWSVFAASMLGVGIPHGAVDHLIVQETARREGLTHSRARFLAGYALTMALYALAWRIAPLWSLGFFLFVSAWHFGDADLEGTPMSARGVLARWLVGTFVLALLLLTHAAEVTPLLDRLTHHHAPTLAVWNEAIPVAGPLLLGLGGLTLMISRWAPPLPLGDRWLAGWAAVLAVGCLLPLLVAFALYFGGWHAWRSLRAIQRYLGGASRFRVWLKALPFTALALAGLGLLVLMWRVTGRREDPLPVLFIFLAVLTLPHLRVMHGLHQRLA
ncbi:MULTISPECIES: Brp/Blh family beta-carotene 15,15'-dioxygenase [unclassified Corallococcus]|uniref:Brp/Blh family beta-carotene 15,15'-dioxygenase n=1 Tax=unclassified Corallococcus TaxID=2685029 RepID=UPI001A8C6A39|nr:MULTISPECIES: Brp/Blh family beta-carotene 15,15'-dioxygenase [unclassified Corallococcus]MBN9687705.1 Brp/Blh family beta-carotene 15,15'-dioxygenase [Corallococcus sp. NCSPR001]WAS88482.1 Brp/Blh family beta-carotene 15,15'-dioxygenase [Corallococcus sp. NCRR]